MIERIELELKNANEVLELSKKRGFAALSDDSLETLSPTAAAASKLLKSGMTLTQVMMSHRM